MMVRSCRVYYFCTALYFGVCVEDWELAFYMVCTACTVLVS